MSNDDQRRIEDGDPVELPSAGPGPGTSVVGICTIRHYAGGYVDPVEDIVISDG